MSALLTVVFLSIAVQRYRLSYRFDSLFSDDPKRWLGSYRFMILGNAAAWGLMAGFVHWHYPMAWPAHLVGLVTAGLSAGGMVSQSTHLEIQRPFTLIILLPIVSVYVAIGDAETVVMSIMYLLYGGFLLYGGTQMSREYWNAEASNEQLRRQAVELDEARRRAEAASMAKSQFLARMSHELRTPMNAILGFSQLLQVDSQLTGKQRQGVEDIVRAGNHLLELINDVLELAKIEAGKTNLIIEPVDLGVVIDSCAKLIQPLAKRYRVQLDYDIDSVRGARILADITRSRQSLLNLMSNGVKYNRHDGAGRLSVRCESVTGDRWRISVCDNGPGIPAEKMSGLFQAFDRLAAEDSDIEGTGIGLVITKHLVELMGGRIGVQSDAGKGSVFWLEFPSADSVAGAGIEQAAADAKPFNPVVTNGKTLLYIDDSSVNLRLITALVAEATDMRVLAETDPVRGLQLAVERKPDLVLLDIRMPVMSGFDVLKCLKDTEVTRDIPVVAISANTAKDDVQKALAAGFVDYLGKPVDFNVLLDVLSRHVSSVQT